MRYIIGADRTQAVLFPQSLDQIIEQDNEVRLIDLFVGSLNLGTFPFHLKGSEEGRPAYHPKDLLKLYVYGYLNSVRSSRALERECRRNVEVMWLLNQLVPDHNTISNFRRDNEKAIRQVFRRTVSIAKDFELIGGKLIAGDSTKLRAQNSKKNNFNEDKIAQHLQYIEGRLDDYNSALEQADSEEGKASIQEQIDKQNDRKDKYNKLREQLGQSGQPQVSTADPESRQLIIRNRVTEVAYSVQTTVDEKHKDDALIVDQAPEPVKGKAEMVKIYAAAPTNFEMDIRWEDEAKPHLIKFSKDGDMAYSLDKMQAPVKDSAGATKMVRNKVLHIWKKDSDGNWKVSLLMVTPEQLTH